MPQRRGHPQKPAAEERGKQKAWIFTWAVSRTCIGRLLVQMSEAGDEDTSLVWMADETTRGAGVGEKGRRLTRRSTSQDAAEKPSIRQPEKQNSRRAKSTKRKPIDLVPITALGEPRPLSFACPAWPGPVGGGASAGLPSRTSLICVDSSRLHSRQQRPLCLIVVERRNRRLGTRCNCDGGPAGASSVIKKSAACG